MLYNAKSSWDGLHPTELSRGSMFFPMNASHTYCTESRNQPNPPSPKDARVAWTDRPHCIKRKITGQPIQKSSNHACINSAGVCVVSPLSKHVHETCSYPTDGLRCNTKLRKQRTQHDGLKRSRRPRKLWCYTKKVIPNDVTNVWVNTAECDHPSYL